MIVKWAPKIPHLMRTIQAYVESGACLDTRHALDKEIKRKIIRPEILYVLRNGYHEKRKDHYEKRFQTWNYSVRGKTPDRRELRIIVSFEENNLLIITAIDLDA